MFPPVSNLHAKLNTQHTDMKVIPSPHKFCKCKQKHVILKDLSKMMQIQKLIEDDHQMLLKCPWTSSYELFLCFGLNIGLSLVFVTVSEVQHSRFHLTGQRGSIWYHLWAHGDETLGSHPPTWLTVKPLSSDNTKSNSWHVEGPTHINAKKTSICRG